MSILRKAYGFVAAALAALVPHDGVPPPPPRHMRRPSRAQMVALKRSRQVFGAQPPLIDPGGVHAYARRHQ
jgi:hypothetical protein